MTNQQRIWTCPFHKLELYEIGELPVLPVRSKYSCGFPMVET